ncbi:MAG: sigma-70 family RNA polymerase sigma factor [Armatimonadetes bacterium]|nr:sigma-70 family RNA polymerase sigma factor [Armatimonadota bacterium]
MEDLELVRKAEQGNQGAFASLLERYKNAVYSLLYRTIGDREDARDLTQETFLRAYRKLSSFNPAYRFSTWIFRIATNLAIDRHRKRPPRTISLGTDEGAVDIADPRPDPSQEVLGRLKAEAVMKALAKLPEALRAVLVLRFVKKLSYDDIAAIRGEPLGTIKTRIFRGREQMLRQLKTEGVLL